MGAQYRLPGFASDRLGDELTTMALENGYPPVPATRHLALVPRPKPTVYTSAPRARIVLRRLGAGGLLGVAGISAWTMGRDLQMWLARSIAVLLLIGLVAFVVHLAVDTLRSLNDDRTAAPEPPAAEANRPVGPVGQSTHGAPLSDRSQARNHLVKRS